MVNVNKHKILSMSRKIFCITLGKIWHFEFFVRNLLNFSENAVVEFGGSRLSTLSD